MLGFGGPGGCRIDVYQDLSVIEADVLVHFGKRGGIDLRYRVDGVAVWCSGAACSCSGLSDEWVNVLPGHGE